MAPKSRQLQHDLLVWPSEASQDFFFFLFFLSPCRFLGYVNLRHQHFSSALNGFPYYHRKKKMHSHFSSQNLHITNNWVTVTHTTSISTCTEQYPNILTRVSSTLITARKRDSWWFSDSNRLHPWSQKRSWCLLQSSSLGNRKHPNASTVCVSVPSNLAHADLTHCFSVSFEEESSSPSAAKTRWVFWVNTVTGYTPTLTSTRFHATHTAKRLCNLKFWAPRLLSSINLLHVQHFKNHLLINNTSTDVTVRMNECAKKCQWTGTISVH